MYVQIITFDDEAWFADHFEVEPDRFLAVMEGKGWKPTGHVSPSYLRQELRGVPTFVNLAGPMWGGRTETGEPIVRFENRAACKILSR